MSLNSNHLSTNTRYGAIERWCGNQNFQIVFKCRVCVLFYETHVELQEIVYQAVFLWVIVNVHLCKTVLFGQK